MQKLSPAFVQSRNKNNRIRKKISLLLGPRKFWLLEYSEESEISILTRTKGLPLSTSLNSLSSLSSIIKSYFAINSPQSKLDLNCKTGFKVIQIKKLFLTKLSIYICPWFISSETVLWLYQDVLLFVIQASLEKQNQWNVYLHAERGFLRNKYICLWSQTSPNLQGRLTG